MHSTRSRFLRTLFILELGFLLIGPGASHAWGPHEDDEAEQPEKKSEDNRPITIESPQLNKAQSLQPEYHFNENDTLYKMIQRNLDAARNLREFIETGVKKPNVNYNYWVYRKSRRGGYYAQIDPTAAGQKLNAQTQLNGALKELETRINELKSRNIRPADSVLRDRVADEVHDVINPGLNRVEEAMLKSGIVVPHSENATKPNSTPEIILQPNSKVSINLDKLKKDPLAELFLGDLTRPKTVALADYPKVKEADGHFEKLKDLLKKIESLDKKRSGLSSASVAGRKLIGDLDLVRTEFLKVYSDFMALKEYHSASVVRDLPAFEGGFKKIVDEKNAKANVAANDETFGEDNHPSNPKVKDQAKAKARREIDSLRGNIIKTIQDQPAIGKLAESKFRETLERLKTLEDALNLSDSLSDNDLDGSEENNSRNESNGDNDSRWLASLNNSYDQNLSHSSVSNPVDSSLKNSPASSSEADKKQSLESEIDPSKSRDEKRKFVDSLANVKVNGGERVSAFETESNLHGSEIGSPESRKLDSEVSSSNPNLKNESNPKEGALIPSGNGLDTSGGLGKITSEKGATNVQQGKTDESALSNWFSSFSKDLGGLKSALSNYYQSGKLGSSAVSNLEENKTALKSAAEQQISLGGELNAKLGEDEKFSFPEDGLGFSIRDYNRKNFGRGANKIKTNLENSDLVSTSVMNLNSNYYQPNLVGGAESSQRAKKPETQYLQNPDGTWSPVTGKAVANRTGSSKFESEGMREVSTGESVAQEIGKLEGLIESSDLEGVKDVSLGPKESQSFLGAWGGPAVDSISRFLAQIYEDSDPSTNTEISDLMEQGKTIKFVGKPQGVTEKTTLAKAINSEVSKPGLFEKIKSWLGLN